jgi:8-oxo-dGTP pyrophosphatase MutT (NUDIX family)
VHRQDLLNQLSAYLPDNPAEAEYRRRLIAFVEGHADCFERSLAEGHVTGSAWIVDPERRLALLVHHRKLGKWLQPGGHADGNPDVAAVALAEAREETGLVGLRPAGEGIFDVDIHEIPALGETPAHLHYDLRYLLEADPGAVLTVSDESHAAAWRPLAAIAAEGEESLARMARKSQRIREPVQ